MNNILKYYAVLVIVLLMAGFVLPGLQTEVQASPQPAPDMARANFQATQTPSVTPSSTGNPPVDPPTLVAPANGSTVSQNPPEFVVVQPGGAIWTDIHVENEDRSFILNFCIPAGVAGCTPPTSPFPSGTYYWKAWGCRTAGCGPASEEWSFIIPCLISVTAPSLTSPAHLAHTTDRTPTFKWSNVAGAESYRILIYNSDHSFEFKKRVFTATHTMTTPLTPQKYLWRVRTQDEGCRTWTSWSQRNTLFVD